MPFAVSFPVIHVLDPASLEPVSNEGEKYAQVAVGGYTVREIDTKGGTGKVIRERQGTNFPVPWDWYVDKTGRSKVV